MLPQHCHNNTTILVQCCSSIATMFQNHLMLQCCNSMLQCCKETLYYIFCDNIENTLWQPCHAHWCEHWPPNVVAAFICRYFWIFKQCCTDVQLMLEECCNNDECCILSKSTRKSDQTTLLWQCSGNIIIMWTFYQFCSQTKTTVYQRWCPTFSRNLTKLPRITLVQRCTNIFTWLGESIRMECGIVDKYCTEKANRLLYMYSRWLLRLFAWCEVM